jgi:hypothetical protein
VIGIEPIGVNRIGTLHPSTAPKIGASTHYDQRGANSKILASAVSVRSAIALPRLAASNGRCRRYLFCWRIEVVGENVNLALDNITLRIWEK